MAIAKTANLALSFLLELAMLAAFGYWGFTTGDGLPAQILLGIGAPLLAAIVWGIFMAPRASRRLRGPYHLVLEMIIFGLAFIALYLAGQPALTAIFIIIYAINLGLRLIWKQ